MKRPPVVPTVVLVAALVLAVIAVIRVVSKRSPQEPAAAPAVAAPTGGDSALAEIPEAAAAGDTVRTLNVSVYYPSSQSNALVAEPHEIFMTPAPGDRVKQVLADLIAGPDSGSHLRALPRGTRLRQVYVLEDGTAYVDFTAELKDGMRGGSSEELLTVYSIVNSVALNAPEIRRVGILIEGRPVESLNGHLDLRRPIPPSMAFVVR